MFTLLEDLISQVEIETLDKLVFKAKEKLGVDETPLESFKRIVSSLDSWQTFQFIVCMSPSRARSCCQYMSDDQL